MRARRDGAMYRKEHLRLLSDPGRSKAPRELAEVYGQGPLRRLERVR